MRNYNYTSRRKAALRKAQLVSARKRKGKHLKRGALIGATGVAAATLAGSAAYYRHKRSGSQILGPMARSATPTSNLVGVEVPATHAGLRFSRFSKKNGFSVHYMHRNASGDRYIAGYRHRALPKGALKADVGVLKAKVTAKLTGSKLPSHGGVTTEWAPNSASPSELHVDILDAYPQRTGGRSRDPKRRWVAGALTSEGRGRRGSLRIISQTQRLTEGKLLPELEVRARVRDYQEKLRDAGIMPNYAHLVMAARHIRRQGY